MQQGATHRTSFSTQQSSLWAYIKMKPNAQPRTGRHGSELAQVVLEPPTTPQRTLVLFPTQRLEEAFTERNPLTALRNEVHTMVTRVRTEGMKDNRQQVAEGHKFESAMVYWQSCNILMGR